MPRGEKKRKKKVKIKTQNEKIVETDRNIWHKTYEKQSLESGKNSAMYIAAYIICQKRSKIYQKSSFFVDILAEFLKY